MRESSFLFSKQNSQQPKYQGGEKKVMKKSLSLILAIAMVFSMFASVAFAAEATTTTTPKTTEEKYDALKALGIFEGDETGANLTGDMTRAQLAKIVTKLLKVEEDKAANTYTDVPADHWAAGFIGAATTAKAFDGVAPGKFDPEGKVSFQQLATVLVRLTGLAQSTDAVTGKVDEWAKGYVAAAVKELGLSQADYTVNANRGVFVELTFAALPKVVVPGKVSLTEAKATGAQKVTVTFNKAVDTSKAVLSLKKSGTVSVTTKTEWSEDKKVATLTLSDEKINDFEYTVTVTGLDSDLTATFKGEKEKLSKIEFVSASDTIAYASKVLLKVKATNQYDEIASTSAGSYNVVASGAVFNTITKGQDGLLVLSLNTASGGAVQNIGVATVTIMNTENYISQTKSFKIGTSPVITKLVLGEGVYSNKKTFISDKGENVKFAVELYDQYGGLVPADTIATADAPKLVWNGYEPSLQGTVEINDVNSFEAKVTLTNGVEKDGESSFSIYSQAGFATGKVTVSSAKVATKIQLNPVDNIIAAGDTSAYIPVIAYDAQGKQLSTDELVSDYNLSRISISVSGAELVTQGTVTIGTTIKDAHLVRSGENKGKVQLRNVSQQSRSVIAVTAVIATAGASSVDNKIYQVNDVRIPDSIKVATAPAAKGTANAKSSFKFEVTDQYGKKLETLRSTDGNGNVGTAVSYSISVTTATYGDIVVSNDKDPGTDYVAYPTGSYPSMTPATFNGGFKFTVGANPTATDSATFEAKIFKNGTTEIAKVSKTIRIATGDLNYSVAAVSDIFNAGDSAQVQDYNGLTKDVQRSAETSKLRKEVKLNAIDSAGDTVAIPASITAITSSDTVTAKVYSDGSKAWVIGNKAGTATLNVTYKTNNGMQKQGTVAVNVKADPFTVAKLEGKTGNKTIAGINNSNAFVQAELKVTDNYGVTYEKADVKAYNYLFGITFTATNVIGGGTVSISSDGTITTTGTVTSFDLTTYTANGKSISTPFVTMP
jgi:trimeric autotransporter adhesin